MPPQLSIVAPVFNEEGNLKPLAAEVDETMAAAGFDHELILVDDGSTDGSRRELAELACGGQGAAESGACESRVRALALARHCGQSAALLAGIRAARAPLIVTMDADRQNDPADIPAIVALLADHDVVSGARVRRQDALARRLASRIANRARRLVLGDPCTDIGCALKGYHAASLADLPAFDGLHRFLPLIVLRGGGTYAEIPVTHRPRALGRSKYDLRGRFLRGALDLFGVSWYLRRAVSVHANALSANANEGESPPCRPSRPNRSGSP